MPKEISYYKLYLQKYLTDTGDKRMTDEEFISSRADLATDEFESQRREGADVFSAQESAMNTLMEGLSELTPNDEYKATSYNR